MAFSKLTGKGIDLTTNVITEFNSTGIDDNATSTAITIAANNSVAIPNLHGNTTTIGNLTVGGDFIVQGNNFTVDADSLRVEDSLIQLAANNETSDVIDIGFFGHYSNDGNTALHTGFFRDASDEQYYLFNGLEDANLDANNSVTTIDRAGTGFTLADLNVGIISATKLSSREGVLELDDDGTHNGIINVPATLLINIDSDNNNTGESFRIAKDRTGTSGGTELFRVQEDGKVGIGTDSPAKTLTVNSGATSDTAQFGNDYNSFVISTPNNLVSFDLQSGSALRVRQGATQPFAIDTSGTMLVGKTSTAFGTAGIEASATNGLWSTRTNLPPLALNRLSTNGSIIDLYKDSGLIGSIGSEGGDSIYIGNGDTGLKFSGGADAIQPFNTTTVASRDDAIDLGTDGARFGNLYMSGFISSGSNIGAKTLAVASGGVTSLKMQQARGTTSSPTSSASGGDGTYIVGEVYNGSSFNAIGHIAIVTDSSGITDGKILFRTATSGTVSTKMYLDSDGNAGIGADPVAGCRLRLGGGQLLLNNGVEIRSFDTSGNQKTIARINTSNELEYGWSGSGPVKFMGGGSYTERMRIDSSGNVGIGVTSSAGDKLEVNGSIRQSGTTAYPIKVLSDSFVYYPHYNTAHVAYYKRSVHPANSNQYHYYWRTSDSGAPGGANETTLMTLFTGSSTAGRLYVSDGLTFSSSGAATQTLDDYEEGTWTPAFTTSGTLTVNSATYTKIGRQVTCRFYLSAATSCSGDINGLPFTPNGESAGVVGYQTNTAGETYGILVQAANVWNLRIGQTQYGLSAGKQIRGMFTYFTDA